MKRKTTTIIFVILLALGAAAFIGYRMIQEKREDVVNKEPHIITDVATLLDAFETDTAAAVRTYLDRIIRVTGRVKSVDTTGAAVLGEEDSSLEVVVGFDHRHMEELKTIQPGTIVVLQGVCSGYSGGSADPDDLLASLGTTVQLRSAGLKNHNQ